MKKLLVTTLVAATVATGFAAQAEAAEKPVKIYSKVQTVQLEQINNEQIQNWVKDVCNVYKLPFENINELKPQPVEDQANKQPAIPEKEQVDKQPTPQKEEQVEKQPTPQKEEQADKQPAAPEKQPEVKQPEPTKEATPAERPVAETPEQQQNPSQSEETNTVTQEEQQMIDLVNQERSKQGLSPLKVNEELTKVARVKAQDMIDNNYFAHESPTYGSPFDMLNQFGVQYRTAGENLAGNQSVEAAHQALMNSDGHRANILGSNYQEVGIGIINGGSYGKMFVQLFKG